MERQFQCIDGQTNISSLSIELYCKKMAANYKRTAHQLDAILEDSKGAISPTLGGKILINTGDDKRLAKAIVEEVKHYFGDPKNKPKNTADAALIIDKSDDWLEGIKRSSAKTTHQEYIDLVVEKTRQRYTIDAESRANGEFTKSFDEIIKAVEQWAEATRKQTPLNSVEQPAPTQPNSNKKKGRPTILFKDLMLNDEGGEHLKKIHALMNGKSGKDAVLIMLACIKKGWITKPTHTQVTKEFGDIGSKQNYSSYLCESRFTKEELDGAINSLG